MRKILKKIHKNHQELWTQESMKSVFYAFLLLGVALTIQRMADNYVIRIPGTPVNDVFLSNIPTINIETFIIQGALAVTFFGISLCMLKPKYLSFGLKTLSSFIIIRSFFISLTHLGPDLNQIPLDSNTMGFDLYKILYNTSNDFFFSAHTGIPLLLAFIFWPERGWRYFFMGASMCMGLSVLLAHIHYSIDVFAAPFITYSIFTISRKLFAKDYNTSLQDGMDLF